MKNPSQTCHQDNKWSHPAIVFAPGSLVVQIIACQSKTCTTGPGSRGKFLFLCVFHDLFLITKYSTLQIDYKFASLTANQPHNSALYLFRFSDLQKMHIFVLSFRSTIRNHKLISCSFLACSHRTFKQPRVYLCCITEAPQILCLLPYLLIAFTPAWDLESTSATVSPDAEQMRSSQSRHIYNSH